jgi:hypothetical protein
VAEPNRIRAMTDEVKARVDRLEAELASATSKKAASSLRRQIRLSKSLERWLRTRNGYA